MSGGDPDRERDARSGESPFVAARKPSLLASAVPVSKDLPRYRLHTARGDVIAAATVAAVALPAAMAYAEVAGLSPLRPV
jgi:SulP family sulfate permease